MDLLHIKLGSLSLIIENILKSILSFLLFNRFSYCFYYLLYVLIGNLSVLYVEVPSTGVLTVVVTKKTPRERFAIKVIIVNSYYLQTFSSWQPLVKDNSQMMDSSPRNERLAGKVVRSQIAPGASGILSQVMERYLRRVNIFSFFLVHFRPANNTVF